MEYVFNKGDEMKHTHYDLIIAWANGAQIQYKNSFGDWGTTPNPPFYKDTKYRVMKEPKKVKVQGWINIYADGDTGNLYKTKEDAEKYFKNVPHKTIFISEEIKVEE